MALAPVIKTADAQPEVGEVQEAAFGAFVESNWITAAIAHHRDYKPTPEELKDLAEGRYDYKQVIPQGFEQYGKDYALTSSPREAAMLTENIMAMHESRKLQEAYPGVAFAGALVGAATSPEQLPLYFLPGSGIIADSSLVRTGLKSAKFGAMSAAVAEATVGQTLPGRTTEESAYAIGGSALFAGTLGVLGKSLGNIAEVHAAVKKLDADMANEGSSLITKLGPAENFDGSTPREVYDHVVKTVNDEIKAGNIKLEAGVTKKMVIAQEVKRLQAESTKLKHPTLYKIMGKLHPAVRFATSQLPEARLFGAQLVDSALQRRGASIGPSAQLVIEQQIASIHSQIPMVLQERYRMYRDSTKSEILTYNEFRSAVGEAMATGDQHANAFVQDAAKDLRKVLKPVEDRLVENGLIKAGYDGHNNLIPDDIRPHVEDETQLLKFFKADGSPRRNIAKLVTRELNEQLHAAGKLTKRAAIPLGDTSYFHRRYDLVKIRGNRAGFHEDLKNIFRDDFVEGSMRRIEALEREIEVRKSKIKPGDSAKGNQATGRRTAEQIIKDLETKLEETRRQVTRDIALVDADIDKAVDEVIGALMREEAYEGYRIKSVKAGPLKGRTFDVSFNRVKPWLVSDAAEAWYAWSKQVIPDLVLTEKFGDRSAQAVRDKVLKAYREEARRLETLNDTAGAKKVYKELEQFNRDSDAMVQILRHRYQRPHDPASMLHKSSQYLRWGAMVTRLGMMTVSAIPDLGIIVARQGLNALKFGKHVVGFSPAVKQNRTFLKQLGVMADLFTSHRIEMLNMLDGNYALSNRVDRFAHAAVQKFNQLTLMNHWNAHLKAFTSGVYAFGIIDDAARAVSGKLTAAELARYTAAGLDEADMKAIGKLTKQGSDTLPDFTTWSDQSLAERFKMAIFKEAETTVITPGAGDLPLTSHSDLGKIMFQFKSFAIAANHRLLMTTIDDLTAQKVIGLASMAWFGYLSYAAKQYMKGEEPSAKYDDVVKHAIDGSGIFALWGDINLILEKATKGNVSAYKLLGLEGDQLNRHQWSGLTDLIAGPSAGMITDLSRVATALTSGDVKESDVRAVRRMLYLNNHFLLHKAFTDLEKVALESLK